MNNIENKNGSIVALEFARNQIGRVVKTHIPEHGEATYDVQIDYEFNPEAKKESFRIRDLPYRCLIWEPAESLLPVFGELLKPPTK